MAIFHFSRQSLQMAYRHFFFFVSGCSFILLHRLQGRKAVQCHIRKFSADGFLQVFSCTAFDFGNNGYAERCHVFFHHSSSFCSSLIWAGTSPAIRGRLRRPIRFQTREQPRNRRCSSNSPQTHQPSQSTQA